MSESSRETPNGISCSENEERVLVTLWGEIDISLREDASAAMVYVVRSAKPIIVDAKDISFIDSSGLAFLLHLNTVAKENRLQVELRNPTENVLDLLEVVGMVDRFKVVNT